MGSVAVDTGAGHLGVDEERLLAEGGEVALVDAHAAVELVGWRDAPIGDAPCLQVVGTDEDGEGGILCPLAIALGADGHGELAAAVLLYQTVPLVDGDVGV